MKKLTVLIVLLMTLHSWATIILVKPGDNVSAKLAAANSGDVVTFEGVFNLGGTVLQAKEGVTYTKLSSAELRWAASNDRGFSGTKNNTFRGLKLVGRGIHWNDSSGSRILGCTFADAPGIVLRWDAGNDVQALENDFVNVNGYGCFETYAGGGSGNRIVVEYNRYWNVAHGGHFLGLGDDCSFSYNYGKGIYHMLAEIQNQPQTQKGSRRMKCVGNVADGWTSIKWGNACAISFMSQWSTDFRFEDNYANGYAMQGAKTTRDDHWSMGFEVAGDSGTCRRNIVGGQNNSNGTFVAFITSSVGADGSGFGALKIEDSKFYGTPGPMGTSGVQPHNVVGWPSSHPGGYGRFVEVNSKTFPYSQMPPAVLPRRPSEGAGETPPPPPPDPTLPGPWDAGITASVLSETNARIRWTSLPPGTTALKLVVWADGDPTNYTYTYPQALDSQGFTFVKGQQNWKWTSQLVATTPAGEVKSGMKGFKTETITDPTDPTTPPTTQPSDDDPPVSSTIKTREGRTYELVPR